MKKIISLICAIFITVSAAGMAETTKYLVGNAVASATSGESTVFSDDFSYGRGNFTGHGVPYVSVATEGNEKYLSIRDGYYATKYFTLYKEARYKLTAKVRCGSGGKFTLSYFNEGGIAIGTKTHVIGDTSGEWITTVYEFKFQKAAEKVCIFLHSGDYDDFNLSFIEEPPAFFNDVQFVYYTQLVNADIKITPNKEYYADGLSGSTINLKVLDGASITYEISGLSAAVENKVSIPILTAMRTYGKNYVIQIDCCNSLGDVIYRFSGDICRFSRPTMIDESGKMIVDGKPFAPVIGYTTPPSLYPQMAKLGINVVASVSESSSDAAGLLGLLDEADTFGLKVLAVFYNTYKTATSTVAYQKTEEAVNLIKNHSALLGYMVMDEPGNEDSMIAELKSTYKLIRSLDMVHPVYLCECMPYAYEDIIKCSDILCVDPYPTTCGNLVTYVSNRVRIAKDAIVGRQKTLTAVFRAFYSTSLYQTANEMRHMAYQALLCGVDGIGWFNIGEYDNQGCIWDRTTIWDGVSHFAAEEQEDALAAFCLNEYEILSENTESGQPVWWKAFEKNGDIHLIVLSNTLVEQNISVPIALEDRTINLGMTIPKGDIFRLVLEKTSWGYVGNNIISGGSEAVGMAGGLGLRGRITAVNISGEPQNVQVFLTLNSNQTMDKVISENFTISENETYINETEKNLVTSGENTEARLFIWDSDMKPYTKRKVCN